MNCQTIIVPQGAEYHAVCRGLKQAQKAIEVIPIPIGVNYATKLLQDDRLLQKSRRVLMLGLCGSLSAHHRAGDVVIYRDCYDLQRNVRKIDGNFSDLIAQRLILPPTTVTALTSDRIIYRAIEKLALSKTYEATVIDMESFVYLKELQLQNIKVAIVRVVSDDVTGNIPDLSNAIDAEGKLRPIQTAIAMLRQPLAATRLINGSLKGLKILQQVTHQLFIDRAK
jgi:nucleoside phosphorylase